MKRLVYLVVLALIFSVLNIHAITEEELENVVKTDSGAVRGKSVITSTKKTVTAFSGIPYANPPIGDLRFEPPEPAKPWSDVRDATGKPKACPQLSWDAISATPSQWWAEPPETFSEDCLYLNIWTPNPKPEKAAVLVWIHGGGYFCGHSTIERYSGDTLAAEENIIVVSLNYRLTVFGFLFSDTTEAPGNVGLLDQALAVQWVYQNIEHFGGDPKKITIMGHSAGSASVSFQLAALSKANIVKRGILLSGTYINNFAFTTKKVALENTIKLFTVSGCYSSSKDTNGMVRCLKKLTTDELMKATIPVALLRGPLAFSPVYDGKLVSKTPSYDNVKEVMFGETMEDGAFSVDMFAKDLLSRDYNHEEWIQATKFIMASDKTEVAELVHSFYTNWTDPDDEGQKRSNFIKMTTDVIMSCPIHEFANFLIKQGVISYRFVFDHVPSVSHFPKWYGSVHGDEIEFVFGGVLKEEKGFSNDEMTLSKNIMKLIANFVKTGNPNEENEVDNDLQWPTFTRKRKHLHLGLENKVGSNHRLTECSLWKHVFRELLPKENQDESCFSKPIAENTNTVS